MSDLVLDVKVVISGINEGANLGDDTTYSSTAGAAIEGALLGVGSIAVSQQSRDRRFRLVDRTDYDWTTSSQVVVTLAERALASPLPTRTMVNVNIPGSTPDVPTSVTHLGQRAYRRGGLEMAHTDLGHGFYTFHVNEDVDPPYHAAPGTDFAALAAGAVSITPLSFAWGDREPFRAAVSWAEAAARTVDDELGIPRQAPSPHR
jgi:5'-nucleotidase